MNDIVVDMLHVFSSVESHFFMYFHAFSAQTRVFMYFHVLLSKNVHLGSQGQKMSKIKLLEQHFVGVFDQRYFQEICGLKRSDHTNGV